jgi:hypothetical protein
MDGGWQRRSCEQSFKDLNTDTIKMAQDDLAAIDGMPDG